MLIYIICRVRTASPEITDRIAAYVAGLEAAGHAVHFPPRDVDQSDETGLTICAEHGAAMRLADEVHVFWDAVSSGSHFDLGMAYALGKRAVVVDLAQPDVPGKSYVKVMQAMTGGDYCAGALTRGVRFGHEVTVAVSPEHLPAVAGSRA